MPNVDPDTTAKLTAFIKRWDPSGGAERANYQLFLTELCDLLSVPHPDPATPDDSKNNYVFDRSITATNADGSAATNFIDLYYRAHFILETKQGIQAQDQSSGADAPVGIPTRKPRKLKQGHGPRESKIWDDALLRAKSQAESYVRSIPDDNPPFLLVVDVGYQIETYADFSGLGKTYTPFPNNLSHRFKLTDLLDEKRGPELLSRLQKIWTDPQSLNPAKHAAKVTRKIAASLAELSKKLEAAKHDPEDVAHFLMRILFTLFAEDVKLIKDDAFTKMLESIKDKPELFAPSAEHVWRDMDKGAPSPLLRQKLLHFNGGLFAETKALPLNGNQLELLIEAATQDWSDVEPAIFGTLLERALNPTERHKLGAHYTPRTYVERLVLPTVIEPLREEWTAAKDIAIAQAKKGKLDEAIETVGQFLKHLTSVTILDPACGSGNFLYVTLEHLKRLEGEVQDFVSQFPGKLLPLKYISLTVDPHQLRGIEINPRAAAITDLVLWIGYLQWHFRTHGNTMPQEPVLKKFDNIENRDAILAYDAKEQALDEKGRPLFRWDGVTYKKHPVTGEDIPDESSCVPVYLYTRPREASWPSADYVLGNPPYIGVRKLRLTIGDEYVEALTEAFDGQVPETCDLVMYWWHKAAKLISAKAIRRFGFITTNSITQPYSRKLTELHLSNPNGVRIIFAVPDHPWVEAEDGAAVRIAMTVVVPKDMQEPATISRIIIEAGEETTLSREAIQNIGPFLEKDLGLQNVSELKANQDMCFQGLIPGGDGFKLRPEELLDLGIDINSLPSVIRPYIIGRDLVQQPERKFVIDFYGLDEEQVRHGWPILYQRILTLVKPDRDQNKREVRKKNWWLFAENAPKLRRAVLNLTRYIVTPYTSKYRVFTFTASDTLPDAMAYAIALDDAWILGVLSSRAQNTWALSVGGTLGPTPRYNSRFTFNPFPFPDCSEKQKSRIRKIAEELDAHRKRQQAKFSDLTLTDVYNILEKLRAADRGEMSAAQFSPKDKLIHDHGLISILKQLHDELDAAVFDAYGWPQNLTDEQILEKLVALNYQRIEEEKHGDIKYLRGPEFQLEAKDFFRLETIPRLAKASPDFPYFSLDAVRADLKTHNIQIEPQTFSAYMHEFTQKGIIFDAGRGWYSSLSVPFSLDHKPVAELAARLDKRFPFLNFSIWSTAQIAPYGHNLLARFVTFVYTDKDAIESISDVLRDDGFTIYLDPSPAETQKSFRINDKTIVIRPSISESPVEGKFSTIEKIIVDFHVESQLLDIVDMHELQRLTSNIVQAGRISMGTLVRYAEHRRKIDLKAIFGGKIN